MRYKMNKITLLEPPISVLQQEQRLSDMLMWSEFVNLRQFCISRQLLTTCLPLLHSYKQRYRWN